MAKILSPKNKDTSKKKLDMSFDDSEPVPSMFAMSKKPVEVSKPIEETHEETVDEPSDEIKEVIVDPELNEDDAKILEENASYIIERNKKNKKKKSKKHEDTSFLKKFTPLKKKFLTAPHIKQWWKNTFHAEEVLMINMELRNGNHDCYVIRAKGQSFKYKEGTYVLDNELKYYHMGAKLYALDYHQDFCMPIKKSIPVNEIGKALSSSGISEIIYATNPLTLENFLNSKIAEGIMKGQQIDEYLKQMKLILIITMVSSVLMLLLFVLKSGMLQGVKIPGLG